MKALKSHSPHRPPIGERLALCVDKVGGKRAMAAAALISEAQLFRYLNGESDMPSDKLMAVANAAKVDAGWLLTGTGNIEGFKVDLRPSFRPELMVQVAQLLEELLVEFDKPFNPRQRARAITYLYSAFRHEEGVRQQEYQLQKFDILKCLNYLAEIRTEEELEVMTSAMNLLEYKQVHEFVGAELELLRTWCNLLVRATKGYYSSYPGQVYYERRLGGQLSPEVTLKFQNMVAKLCTLTGKTKLDWLDLGCGSGRHLVHMAKHMSNLTLKGIELSPLGYNMCKGLMESEKIPAGCVVQGDARQMPYATESFDVVYSYMSLYGLPYLQGTGIGMEEAFAEVTRVLRKNGVAVLSFPMGNWRDYSMPHQYMDESSINKIASGLALDVFQFDIEEIAEAKTADNPDLPSPLKFNYKKEITVWIRKK